MKILFVLSHPDDESFGPAGTIAKLSKDNLVRVISLCKGNRPGAVNVDTIRQDTFIRVCNELGVESCIFNSSDLYLDYHQALLDIENTIKQFNPDVVYTHNISDIHRDHRTTAEAVMAACRPKPTSAVKELYFCEIPASTEWTFGQIDPVFIPNTYVDVTDYIELKKHVIGLYGTEIYEWPDARSVESVEVLAKYRGRQIGARYAEAFRLVFSRK
jgi:LmbE family N-acetylglucosaminyl deacetylase